MSESEAVVLDPSALERLRRIGGEALVGRMLALFRELAPKHLAAVVAGLEAGDGGAAAEAAHALKSTAGNVGGDRLRLRAGELEAAARAGALDEARALSGPLAAALDVTLDALQCGEGANGEGT